MSQESLSALLDGECSPAELDRLLNDLESNPSLKQAYSRMVLSREAREGIRVSRAQPDICAAVMARLDEAPQGAKVVEMAPPRKAPRFEWKPLAGLAAAASFGAMAVLVAMPEARQADASASPAVIPTAIITPVSAPAVRKGRNLRAVSLTGDELQQWQEDELRAYLIEHSNTLADRGVGGTLSYARFAAHNGDEVPAIVTAEEVGR